MISARPCRLRVAIPISVGRLAGMSSNDSPRAGSAFFSSSRKDTELASPGLYT